LTARDTDEPGEFMEDEEVDMAEQMRLMDQMNRLKIKQSGEDEDLIDKEG
jgi:hypothetical protein